jgi:ferric-dicitrate binding protein FerR (iron transport regulator)
MVSRQRRWDELQARWASGERLSADEERERLEYASVDPLAREELLVFAELRNRATCDDAGVSPALIDDVLDAVRGRPRLRLVTAAERRASVTARGPRRVSAQRGLLVAAALAVAGVLVAVFGLTASKSAQTTPQAGATEAVPVVQTAAARLALAAGQVTVDGRKGKVDLSPLLQGQTLETHDGSACLIIEPSVDVCLAGHSALRLESLDARHVRLRVEAGTALASLSRRAPGSSFSFVMADVSATATGTTFAARRANGGGEVIVVEGMVDVARGAGRPERLSAHSRALVRAAGVVFEPAALSGGDEARLLALRASHSLWSGPSRGALQLVSASPVPLLAGIDDASPLPLPLQALVAGGKHRVTWRDAAGSETSSWVEIREGETRRLEAPARGPPPAAAAGPPVETRSPAALLEAARREIARGKPREALAFYEKLGASYPNSAEAHTVRVTIGKLELGAGKYERALRQFDAYLRQGGALAPEAMAGKVHALHALGRRSEERAAIQQYLARNPSGLEAPLFQKQLRELERP